MDLNAFAHVRPPYEGEVSVTEVTAGTASAAISLGALQGAQYVSIVVDDGAGTAAGAYLTAKASAAPADPDPTADTGTGRCFYFPADQVSQLVFNPADQIKVLVPGSGTYYVRAYPSGPQG